MASASFDAGITGNNFAAWAAMPKVNASLAIGAREGVASQRLTAALVSGHIARIGQRFRKIT